MANRQYMTGDERPGTNQPLSQSQAIARRSAVVPVSFNDQHRRLVQTVREIVSERGEGAKQDRRRQEARMGSTAGLLP